MFYKSNTRNNYLNGREIRFSPGYGRVCFSGGGADRRKLAAQKRELLRFIKEKCK